MKKVILLVLLCVVTLVSLSQSTMESKPKYNLTLGWVYGIGGELEFRPNKIGLSVGVGYVPKLGVGGYLGVTIAQNELKRKGILCDLGAYYGVENSLRKHPDGIGAYTLVGYNFILLKNKTLKVMPGIGIPFQKETTPEFLMKLTLGRS